MHSARMARIATLLTASLGLAQKAPAKAQFETPIGTVSVHYAPPAPEAPKDAALTHRLWLGYPNAHNEYLDQLDYVISLRDRWRKHGLQVGVILPIEEAKALAATQPPLLVCSPAANDAMANSLLAEQPNGHTYLCDAADEVVATLPTPDGLEDMLAALKDGRPVRKVITAKRWLESLVEGVADGGQFGPQVKQVLKALPTSGRAHASAVLYHWWCRGDLNAAREAVDVALESLAGHSLPLATFADLVVRGDHEDPEIAALLAKALAPTVKNAKHGAFTQLVYLRALLKSRRDHRTAGRMAAILPKRLKGRPTFQIFFAETLMDGSTPEAFRDTAERALKAAEGLPQLKRWVFCARHKVLMRCGDHDGANALMAAYRKDPVGQGDHNNDAWYLMVQPQTMGRFDSLALAQAEKMQELQANGISVNSKDTVALALFRSGHIEKAIALQKETNPQNNAAYLGRFKRYEAVLAQRKAKIEPAKANK